MFQISSSSLVSVICSSFPFSILNFWRTLKLVVSSRKIYKQLLWVFLLFSDNFRIIFRNIYCDVNPYKFLICQPQSILKCIQQLCKASFQLYQDFVLIMNVILANARFNFPLIDHFSSPIFGIDRDKILTI